MLCDKTRGARQSESEELEDFENCMEYLNPSSPKVAALYDAVRALSREGSDLTQLKVSDIAARAGIGKGTVYDYFKSREELIVKAVLHTIYQYICMMEKRIQETTGFRQKVYVVLDILFEQNEENQNFFQYLMPFFYDIGSVSIRFREEFEKCTFNVKWFGKIGKILFGAAVEEGLFEGKVSFFYVQTALLNMILNYAIFRKQSNCKEWGLQLSDEEVKQRLYENFVYGLRESGTVE